MSKDSIIKSDRESIKEQLAKTRSLLEAKGFSSGYPFIDWVGGDEKFLIPKGGVSEISGLHQTGKTTLLFEIVAYNQKLAKERGDKFRVLWCDYERSLPLQQSLAEALGVEFDDSFVRIAPRTLESGAQVVIEHCRGWGKRRPHLVVIDTAAAARPAAEQVNKLGGTKQPAIRGKLWSEFYRNLVPELDNDGPAVVVINQVFKTLDLNPYKPQKDSYYSPGTNALKFYAVARYFLTNKKQIKIKNIHPLTYEEEIIPVGHYTQIRAEKSKYGKPYRVVSFVNYYGTGISPVPTIISAAEARQKQTGKQLIYRYQNNARFDVLKIPGDKDSRMGLSSLGPEEFVKDLYRNKDILISLAGNINTELKNHCEEWFRAEKNKVKKKAKSGELKSKDVSLQDRDALLRQILEEEDANGGKKYTKEKANELVDSILSKKRST